MVAACVFAHPTFRCDELVYEGHSNGKAKPARAVRAR